MSTRNRHLPKFSDSDAAVADPALTAAARIAIRDSLAVKAGEKVLIVTNPDPDVSAISRALYDAALDAEARPVIVYQPVKTQMDFAEDAVIAAFGGKPDVFISMSAEKLGKDREGIARPYVRGERKWDHVFHVQLHGDKTCRAFWSPSVTLDSFVRTVPVDYDLMKRRCGAIKDILDKAVTVRVSAPGGTDIEIGLRGRTAKSDDGDFSRPGTGGNLPAGETFVSPENNTAAGTIVFDGSISLHDGDIIIREPIACQVEGGYIVSISGGEEAVALQETVSLAERNAAEYEASGRLPAGAGAVYAKNARNIGELGIGLNPAATVSGNMLEDEKAFRTCHFAVGHNYDEDAPALIHLDGLVRNPTIIAKLEDGTEVLIERDGMLAEAIETPGGKS
jgi:leucyl aminopeptidase (aminopeptidase T)